MVVKIIKMNKSHWVMKIPAKRFIRDYNSIYGKKNIPSHVKTAYQAPNGVYIWEKK